MIMELRETWATESLEVAPDRTISPESARQIVAAAEERGELARAQEAGLPQETILKLAGQLPREEVISTEQAIKELEKPVEIALEVISRAERSSNDDSFVNEVLARLAETTRAGRLGEGAAEIDEALAELERRELEQREGLRRSRATLLEAGLQQDILRRDAFAAAQRIEAIVALDAREGVAAWWEAYRQRLLDFYQEGRNKGVNLSLEIAAEMARRMSVAAQDADQQGAALNWLGIVLATLGERDGGTARLEEAVEAYRAALQERTRDRVPLQWAATQNNLGIALQTLGARESETANLEKAVDACRAALEERTRGRVPLDWAMTQNNLGNALQTLGVREGGSTCLEEAVAAYRAALEEMPRDHVPLDWAMTQNNLAGALKTLGEREDGIIRLEEAVAAYRAALEERTRSRASYLWAQTQENLAIAYEAMFNKTEDKLWLEHALVSVDGALEEYRKAQASYDIATTMALRESILKAKDD